MVDRKSRDAAVEAAVRLLVGTSSLQPDGQVGAETTTKPSYASLATQVTLMPTRPKNETIVGPLHFARCVGPQPVEPWSLVVHGLPTYMSMDEIFWHVDKLRIGVSERVVRAHWLVGLDARGSKTASSLVLYFSGMVLVCRRVLRFGRRCCLVDCYDFVRSSVPFACTCCGP